MHLHCILASLISGYSLALGAPTALSKPGTNAATVSNKCPFPVYLWSTPGGPPPPASSITMVTLAANSGTGAATVYSETLHQSPDGSGISIKIGLVPDLAAIQGDRVEQLEYELNKQMNALFYDLSEINGGPFTAKGHKVELSAGPGCPVVHTDNAYHHPDDVATKACKLPSDLILTLCA